MPSGHRRAAFTLLEVVIVLVILAILSTLAVMSLSGTMNRYRISRAVETVERFDAIARRQASHQRVSLNATIDLSRHRLKIESPLASRDRVFPLPGGVKINRVRFPRQAAVGRELDIPFTDDGISPTYALELSRGDLSHWMIILGASGQVVHFDREEEIDEILSL